MHAAVARTGTKKRKREVRIRRAQAEWEEEAQDANDKGGVTQSQETRPQVEAR